jgi:hypothetical protein
MQFHFEDGRFLFLGIVIVHVFTIFFGRTYSIGL